MTTVTVLSEANQHFCYNHFQIYVNMEEREYWLPNQPLDLEVVAEQGSMVCLLGGRSMGNNDIRFDPRIR